MNIARLAVIQACRPTRLSITEATAMLSNDENCIFHEGGERTPRTQNPRADLETRETNATKPRVRSNRSLLIARCYRGMSRASQRDRLSFISVSCRRIPFARERMKRGARCISIELGVNQRLGTFSRDAKVSRRNVFTSSYPLFAYALVGQLLP